MKIFMFGQGDYLNRGCEAIIRSTIGILNRVGEDLDITIASKNYNTDKKYKVKKVNKIISHVKLKKYSIDWFVYIILNKVFKKKVDSHMWTERNAIKECLINDISLSIGGDNYCYGKPFGFFGFDKGVKKHDKPLVFWGCSIAEKIDDYELIEDLSRFDLITARESITYNALIEAGIDKNTKLYPDPAFTLEKEEVKLEINIENGHFIGINVSPLIQNMENESNITYKNYRSLIKYIINNTYMSVLLIPHVFCKTSYDLNPLTQLYSEFRLTGRVFLIDIEYNCMQLKHIISKCRFFIAARTHASIAAYSTCVPTLVVGYSVKARGIARDIFGIEEGYLLPVQQLKDENQLTKAFIDIMEKEDEIKTHLGNFMPSYIEKAWQAGEEVKKLLEN